LARAVWIEDIRPGDSAVVGVKASNLGKLAAAKIRVPKGFCLTGDSYKGFLRETGINEKITSLISESGKESLRSLNARSKSIRNIILRQRIPQGIADEARVAYQKLCSLKNRRRIAVAVRSSSIYEDLPETSFAGVYDSYLNATSLQAILECVVKCWSSLWSPQAMLYRSRCGFKHDRVSMAVIVQELVRSKSAGVMFSVNPVTGDDSEIVVNSCWGLGTGTMSSSTNADTFIVDKESLRVKKRYVAKKVRMIVPSSESFTKSVPTPKSKVEAPSLNIEEIVGLARTCVEVERIFSAPQDIEWAMNDGDIYILQTRAISTLPSRRN